MVIVDTSVWIEFFRGNSPYFIQISELLERNEAVTLSCIFGELLQGAKDSRERTVLKEFWEQLPKMDTPGLFVRAGEASSREKWLDKGVGLIDSAIIVAARESSSFVWTLDQKINKLLKAEERYCR